MLDAEGLEGYLIDRGASGADATPCRGAGLLSCLRARKGVMDEAGSVGWFSAEQRAGLEDFWRVFDAHAVDVGLGARRKLALS